MRILYDYYALECSRYLVLSVTVKIDGYMLKILISENKAPLYSGLDAHSHFFLSPMLLCPAQHSPSALVLGLMPWNGYGF
jgi:hypothetical protein